MKHVIFWGATGQAKVLREALHGEAELLAIFDNRSVPSPLSGIPVFYGQEGLTSWERDLPSGTPIHSCVAIGGGRGRDRFELQGWLSSRGYPTLSVLHPRAFIARDASLGVGCQILAHASVCTHVILGDAVIVNTAASVDHDCRVGVGAHIGPGAIVAGEVEVGEYAFIGAGAVVLPHLRIGSDAVIGAGAVVTRDVASGTVVAGNPARFFPHHTAGTRT